MTTTSPFAKTADPTDTDDMFADPTTDFVTVDDLDGRLIAVYAKELRREQSKNPGGGMYDKIVCDVIVLDGATTEKIGEVPMFLGDMHLSAGAVVGALRGSVGKGTPVLGRVDSRPSSTNRKVLAYGLQKATQEDKVHAAPIVRQVIAARDFAS